MVAPQTVMETENVWLDTATASLDSWVLIVPKVREIDIAYIYMIKDKADIVL